MANGKNGGGFWKGFVYGLLTPLGVGLGVTLIGSLVVLVTGRKQMGDGS